MKILLPTAYLPPVVYMAAIVAAENVDVEICETYPKQTYRNRCQISTPSGSHTLSIPVSKINGNNTLTKDITISNVEKWQLIHWRAIESSYNNSAFFLYYRDEFEDLYFKKHENLVQFNTLLLDKLLKLMHIDTVMIFTDDFEKVPVESLDLRTIISPKISDPLVPKSLYKPYFQAFGDKTGFLHNLSVIDLLFSEGPRSIDYLFELAVYLKPLQQRAFIQQQHHGL
jgi:hypothetical protein